MVCNNRTSQQFDSQGYASAHHQHLVLHALSYRTLCCSRFDQTQAVCVVPTGSVLPTSRLFALTSLLRVGSRLRSSILSASSTTRNCSRESMMMRRHSTSSRSRPGVAMMMSMPPLSSCTCGCQHKQLALIPSRRGHQPICQNGFGDSRWENRPEQA